MFFVISGFLITGILLREMASGTFTLARFYERRARRILPALFAMLAVVGAAAYWLMLPADLRLFAQNVTAIVLFSSNILFWKRAGGFDFYFEPSAQLNPLLHTWSLGVEEQFYFIFPALVLLTWRFFRRWLFPVIVLTVLASFLLSSMIDGHWGLGFREQKEANFYLLPTRAWQLMLGAMVAFYSFRSKNGDRQRGVVPNVVAGAGLAMIVYSMLVYTTRDVYFPSVWALPATIGTALILAFGDGTLAGRLLALRPLAVIGLISYSAYLWHQPMFAFSHYLSLDEGLATSTELALCAASLVIAWTSWRFIESPFRDRRRVSPPVILGVSFAGTASFLALALSLALMKQPPARGHLLSSPELLATLTTTALPASMRECAFDPAGSQVGCELNAAVAGPAKFVVIGDSHAGALRPAFRQLSQQTNQPGRLVVMRGCPPLIGVYAELEEACLAMQPAVLDYVRREHIQRVFLVARWAGYTDGDYAGKLDVFLSEASWKQPRSQQSSRAAIVDGLKRTIDAYTQSGISIDIVAQVPQQVHRPLGIYLQALLRRDAQGFLHEASVTQARHAGLQAFMSETFSAYRASDRVKLIDLAGALCAGGVCAVGTSNQSYYWDMNHLSEAGALHVSDELRRQAFGGSD